MKAFQAVQRQFLAHLRNPKHDPLPNGFAKQGAAIYVDLLYNKFNDSLALCFPVTHELLGEAAWRQLLQAFIAEHRCQSPYYRQIPDEFIRYLQTERISELDSPYLVELAHFEWVEMVLAIADEEPVTTPIVSDVNDWLAYRPLFVPVIELLHYAYPVHHINTNYQPASLPDQSTHILGFRDMNGVVQFVDLQPATARLVNVLQSTGCTVRKAIETIAEELGHPEPAALFSFGSDTIAQLVHQGAIIGVQNELE